MVIGLACRIWLCLVVAVSFHTQAWAGLPPDRIHVLDSVCVDADDISLKDITRASGPHAEALREAFGAEIVATFSASGPDRMTISGATLASRLEEILGTRAVDCIIPTVTTVQRGGRVLDATAIQGLIVDFLTKRTADLPGEIKFREFRLPSPIFLPDTHSRLDVEASRTDPGRVTLTLTAVDGQGKTLRKYSAGAFIDQWVAVPCAARPMNRQDIVGPQAVRFETKNLAFIRGNLWDGLGGPWRMTRSVGMGQPILAEAIEPVPDVRNGDRVQLVFEGKNVTLTVPARALEDGRVGSSIPVLNLQSNREIIARIRSHDRVVVQ